MVNFKTKIDKHTNDNEKRRKSIKEKEKIKSTQSQIIKQALSNNLLNSSSSKKIIFNDVDDDEVRVGVNVKSNKGNSSKENGKTSLFDNSESETDDFEIREKSQFSGKKGFELLNLQSTYGNDDRFKIDKRFFEDEIEEDYEESHENGDSNIAGEKAKELKILESVLGTSVVAPEKEKKVKKRTTEMVRYDASNKDHQIYEINNKTETSKSTPSKKRKEGKKTPKTEDLPIPKVSKEKFYEVSNEIKTRFKEKKEEGGQFSLLQTYGLNSIEMNDETEEVEEDREEEEEEEEEEEQQQKQQHTFENDHFNLEREYETEVNNTKTVKKPKAEEKVVVAKGIWKESFFFTDDDPRFKEGLEFMSKKNSKEAEEAAENYNKTRKQLKEILRLHLKKQMHNKDPFKNKIGGMSKKQLANSRLKNSRTAFNKRKLPKKSPGGRI